MKLITFIKKHKQDITIVISIGVLLFIINVGVLVSEDIAEGNLIKWTFYLINEGTGMLVGVLSVPFLFYFFNRLPFENKPFVPTLLLYMGVSLVYGFSFTTLMYGSRVPLYHLADISLEGKFNGLSFRYLMEYFKQFSTFWLVYMIYRLMQESRKRREEAVKTAELKQLLVQTELEALQMRLNPHFFFNTLNTISSLIYDAPKKADQLIIHLGDFFRKVLQVQDESMHSVQEEINLTQQYVAIMKGRFEEKLQVDFDISEAAMGKSIPILLFQPLIENAIQYSMKQNNYCHASIRVAYTENQLICTVEDNGPGIENNRFPAQMGIGLHTVMSRLERRYNDEHQFTLQNQPNGGLRIEIQFPAHDR